MLGQQGGYIKYPCSSVCGTAEPKGDTGNKIGKRLTCKKTPDSW